MTAGHLAQIYSCESHTGAPPVVSNDFHFSTAVGRLPFHLQSLAKARSRAALDLRAGVAPARILYRQSDQPGTQ